jgi:hypothetical protein
MLKSSLFCASTLLVLFAVSPVRGQIVWNPLLTGTITGPSDIDTNGTFVDAITPHSITNFGQTTQGSGTLTVGDEAFNIGSTSDSYFSVLDSFDGSDGNAPDGLNAYQSPIQEPTPPVDTNSYNYDELMTHCAANDNNLTTVDISNLTVGAAYDVQIWNSTGRQTTYTSTLPVGSSSITLAGGDYTIGKFIATTTTASFTFTYSGSNNDGVISDIALREVPEPSTYGAMALGLVALAGITRLRKLAVARLS